MEKVTLIIQKLSSTMCRITVNDIRTDLKNLSDGGCICDIEILLDEMEHIKNEAKAKGFDAIFKIENME